MPPDGVHLSLAELHRGETARVTEIADPASSAGRKLTAMGVLPGAALVVLQRYPAIVFRIGYSEFAVDTALAGQVRVTRVPR
jgi:DtxR family Mn-dependent transcriptional regulator